MTDSLQYSLNLLPFFLPPRSLSLFTRTSEWREKKKKKETQISAASDETKESENIVIGGEGKTVGLSQGFGLFMGLIYAVLPLNRVVYFA